MIPQQLRLWLTSFSWEEALLRRAVYSAVLQNGYFSPPSSRRTTGFSLWEPSRVLGGKTHRIASSTLTRQWRDPPGVFISLICPHWAFRDLSVTVQVFLPQHWFPRRFLLVGFCSDKEAVSAGCLSYFESSTLGPHFSNRPKKSCGFFSLFGFVLIVGMEGWLPISLHANCMPGVL